MLPNIIIIHAHDLGRHLACYGRVGVATPNLDRLASEGGLFRNAFCVAPQCSPARSALFTGYHPHQNEVLGLTHKGWRMSDPSRHLAMHLHRLGYSTASFGVFHEDDRRGRTPSDYGLDALEVYGAGDGPKIIERVKEFSRDSTKPLYMQIGFFEPHRTPSRKYNERDYMGFIGDYIELDEVTPVEVPRYLRNTEGARREIAEIRSAVAYLDSQVGEILSVLEERKLVENTLLIFTTDHGLALPRAKCTLYDAGLETALIIRYPGNITPGVREEMVSHLDLVPTVLDACSANIPTNFPGRSLLPLLRGEPWRKSSALFGQFTFHTYYDPKRCIRTQTHKLIVNFTDAPAFMDCSQSWRPRSEPYNLSHFVEGSPPVELYDLQNDPWEMQNLANTASVALLQQSLLSELGKWMEQTADPLLHGPIVSFRHEKIIESLHTR